MKKEGVADWRQGAAMKCLLWPRAPHLPPLPQEKKELRKPVKKKEELKRAGRRREGPGGQHLSNDVIVRMSSRRAEGHGRSSNMLWKVARSENI